MSCFQAYKFSIMYSRNALLVDIDGNQNSGRTLKLDSVKNGEALWKGVDTLIFNTWHWWSHTGRKQPYAHLFFSVLCVYIYIFTVKPNGYKYLKSVVLTGGIW